MKNKPSTLNEMFKEYPFYTTMLVGTIVNGMVVLMKYLYKTVVMMRKDIDDIHDAEGSVH